MADNPYDYGVLATKMFDDDKLYMVEGGYLNQFVVQLKRDLATKKFDYEMQYDWEKRLEAFLSQFVHESGDVFDNDFLVDS